MFSQCRTRFVGGNFSKCHVLIEQQLWKENKQEEEKFFKLKATKEHKHLRLFVLVVKSSYFGTKNIFSWEGKWENVAESETERWMFSCYRETLEMSFYACIPFSSSPIGDWLKWTLNTFVLQNLNLDKRPIKPKIRVEWLYSNDKQVACNSLLITHTWNHKIGKTCRWKLRRYFYDFIASFVKNSFIQALLLKCQENIHFKKYLEMIYDIFLAMIKSQFAVAR